MALLQILRKYFLTHHANIRRNRCKVKIGQCLNAMMLIPSSGQGELPAFMEVTILEISLKEGVRSVVKVSRRGEVRGSSNLVC